MTPTAIHVHPVQEEDDRCEAMEVSPVLQIQFFCFELLIVFCNIPQTTEYLSFSFVAFIPQE